MLTLQNEYGQVGIGKKTKELVIIPTQIKSLNQIVKVDIGTNLSLALDKYGRAYVWGKIKLFRRSQCDHILTPTVLHDKDWILNAKLYGPYVYLQTCRNTIVCGENLEMVWNKKVGIEEIWWWLELCKISHVGRFSYYYKPKHFIHDLTRIHFYDTIFKVFLMENHPIQMFPARSQ